MDGTAWLSAADCAEQCGPDVTAQRVRDWARRGLIHPVDTVRDGRRRFRLYVLADVLAAEHATRTSPRGRPPRKGRVAS